MTENDANLPENTDFQGFSEDFSPALTPFQRLSREGQEYLLDMEKRLARVQRAMLTYGRKPPRALRDEEEVLRANIARFRSRWGLD